MPRQEDEARKLTCAAGDYAWMDSFWQHTRCCTNHTPHQMLLIRGDTTLDEKLVFLGSRIL
jgi:hypothetical protein